MNYKDEIQEHADEIAWAEYDKDFYDLPEDIRDKIYERAQEKYIDHYTSIADSMAEKMKHEDKKR